MKTKNKTTAIVAALMIASPAFAMVELDTQGNVVGGVTTGNQVKTMNLSQELDAQVNTNADVSVTSELIDNSNANVGVEAQTGVSVDAESNQEDSDTVDANSTVTAQEGSMVQVSLSGFTQEEKNRVESEIDAQLRSDSQLKITSKNNSVVVSYNSPVTFMGLFEIDMKKRAVLSMDAQSQVMVKVSKPWWSIFVSADADAQTESELESSIKASAVSSNRAEAFAQAVAQASAELKAQTRVQAGA